MVDFLGMFRRRAPKRGQHGFARSHTDITALGDSIGDLLTSPIRDAPPLSREAPREVPHIPAARKPVPEPDKPRSRGKSNGAAAPAPRLATRAGYLAVH